MREREHAILGLSVSRLLDSDIEHRKRIEPKVAMTGGKLVKMSMEELLEELRTLFFNSLLERDWPDARHPYDELSENLYVDLYMRGIAKDPRVVPFDDLISYPCTVSFRTRQFMFDLRNTFYLFFVIPTALRTWPGKHLSRQGWVLLIGDEHCGKSAWVNSVGDKLKAAVVRVAPRALSHRRTTATAAILKFVKRDPGCLVSIDRLECYRTSKEGSSSPYRTSLHGIFTAFRKMEGGRNVIAMSRVTDLLPNILDLFDIKIYIGNPDRMAKFDLIVHSLSRLREVDRLPKVPQRVFDVHRQVRKMNSGNTVIAVTRKYRKTTPFRVV